MFLADRLQFKGVIIEDENFHIWGSSPIWGNDGRVHVFSSRWPVSNDESTRYGFSYWDILSEIAHFVADRPEGPYSFVRTILSHGRTPAGQWNSGNQHNPTVLRVEDEFILLFTTNTASPDETGPANRQASRRIGMLKTKDLNGSWEEVGCILSAPAEDDVEAWSYPLIAAGRGVDNPALLKGPDGRFLLYYRAKWPGLAGANTYALAVADKLEGPYRHYNKRLIENTRYIEDPYVYIEDGKVCMVVTDNYRDAGLLLRSDDGYSFDFEKAEPAFHVMSSYIDYRLVEDANAPLARKFERPQLLLNKGKPTHLFAPAGCNINKGPGTCCYLLEISH